MKFEDWYTKFLETDKTNLTDKAMLKQAFEAGKNSNQVEAVVMEKIANNYLDENMPEDYEIADEPSISLVYDKDKNIIENELYMIVPLRKK